MDEKEVFSAVDQTRLKIISSEFSHTAVRSDEKLEKLNENIEKTIELYRELINLLKIITFAGVIISMIAVLVAFGALIVEIIKLSQ